MFSNFCHLRNFNPLGYAENGYDEKYMSFMQDHDGLQVYVLTKGNYQNCIIDGKVGQFQDDTDGRRVYKLKDESAATATPT